MITIYMTTASNSINTNSIDTIVGTTTLTIGEVATSVELKPTTTQALTVTGMTTSKIETTTITPSYDNILNEPEIIAGQKGQQLLSFVTSGTSTTTTSAQSGQTRGVRVSGNAGAFVSITLPIGVWNISYTLRIRSASNSPTTFMLTSASLSSPVTVGGVTYPQYLLQSLPVTISNTGGTLTNRPCFSGNIIIPNNVVGNTVSLQFRLNFTGSDINAMGIEGTGNNTITNTFLVATRIA